MNNIYYFETSVSIGLNIFCNSKNDRNDFLIEKWKFYQKNL